MKNIISKENKIELLKRLKSFAWELSNLIGISLVGFMANNLTLLDLPTEVIFILSLVLNQITKTLNKK